MKPGRFKLVFASIAVGVLVVAAAVLQAGRAGDCATADQVSVLDQAAVSGQTVFLVHRVSGAHDKVELFQLYASRPAFDTCGHTPLQPLSEDVYDPGQGLIRKLVLRNQQLEIVYTKDAAVAVSAKQARLSPG